MQDDPYRYTQIFVWYFQFVDIRIKIKKLDCKLDTKEDISGNPHTFAKGTF